jgi:7-carboxy-7-deazaguanine synthase
MQISEIYKSLQGESTYAGLPCVFVRLTGCNLRCSWCDSEFSFYGGKKMSLQISGGEPMLQEREVIPLMEQLLDADYQVLLETSGERPLARVPKQVIKIVDVKCPHSGEPNTFAIENLKALGPHDELKFVLIDRTDYEFARDFVLRHDLAGRVHAILFSPAFEKTASGARDTSHCQLDPQELAQWILADNIPARLSLQIHKLIWDPAAKGV